MTDRFQLGVEAAAKRLDEMAIEQREYASKWWGEGRRDSSDYAAAHAAHLEDAAAAIRSIPAPEEAEQSEQQA